MARNMSFMLTTAQVRNRTKDVTRRLGWATLKPGDIVRAVEKAQGLKRGERTVEICLIRIRSVRREYLYEIESQPDDCRREGFPEMTPRQFIEMFCVANKCGDRQPVNRIEFEYV